MHAFELLIRQKRKQYLFIVYLVKFIFAAMFTTKYEKFLTVTIIIYFPHTLQLVKICEYLIFS